MLCLMQEGYNILLLVKLAHMSVLSLILQTLLHRPSCILCFDK